MPTIIPVNKVVVPPTEPTTLSPSQKDARARAIAKMQAGKVVHEEPKAEQPPKEPEAPVKASEPSKEPTLEAAVEQINTEDPSAEPAAAEETQAIQEKLEESKDPLSSQYAVLARKEKALRAKVQQQEAAMKAREDALRQREEALSVKDNEYKKGYVSKEEFSKNPWKFLADAGITYDQLTEMALNQTKADPFVTSKLEALEAQLAAEREERKRYEQEFKKSQEEQQSAAYKQAIDTMRRDAESLIKANAEQYEMISSTDSVGDIIELIEQTWKEERVLKTVEEAAAEIEAYLEEEALKLSKIKKIQSKLQAPGTKTVTFKEPEAKENKQPQMKTLTNSIGAQKPLSARERAILAARGQLK